MPKAIFIIISDFFTILLYHGVIVTIDISANKNRKFNSQNNRTN